MKLKIGTGPNPVLTALAIILVMFVLFEGESGYARAEKSENVEDGGTGSMVRIVIPTQIPEDQGLYAMGPVEPGVFRGLLNRIGKAARDPKVSSLMLEIKSPQIGIARIQELSHALAAFRGMGKKIYMHTDALDLRDYLLAAGADEICVSPAGLVAVPGLSAEVMFLKGMLDKIGVVADMEAMGEYKSAGETFTRQEMSPESREVLTSILDEYYDFMVQQITSGRGLSEQRSKEIIDQGFFTPREALEAGLVDKVEYRDQFMARLEQLPGGAPDPDSQYGETKKKKLGGMASFFEMMSILQPTKRRRTDDPKIAVVYATGTITEGESGEALGTRILGSDTLVAALNEAGEDPSVRAVVLRVNSPGGSGLASDEIWRAVLRLKKKKPVIASMSDVAGSGGYYIAMGATKILADAATLTGSIGVLGGKLVLGGLYEKIGITIETHKRGNVAGIFSDTAPFSEEERAVIRRIMGEFYEEFVKKAAESRNMDPKALDQIARGRVWTGSQAEERGLVDEIGGLTRSLELAAELGGFESVSEAEILELPEPRDFFEYLEQMLDPGATVISPAGLAAAELQRSLEAIKRLTSKTGIYTLMPWTLEIR